MEGTVISATVLGKQLPSRVDNREPAYPGGPTQEWVAEYECTVPGTTVFVKISDTAGSQQYPTMHLRIPDGGPVPEECANQSAFADVAPGQLFYDEMAWTAAQGISTGWEDGTFRPLLPINRDAMAAFLFRAASEDDKWSVLIPQKPVFADVTSGQQFEMEMGWLAATGISEGWKNPDGTRSFRPLTPINRDAMAAFLYRAAGAPEYTPPAKSPFRDVAVNQQFYKEMAWLADSGISTGWANPDGTKSFQPMTPINRDAMAAFLYRFAHLN